MDAGEEALSILRDRQQEIDWLFTDIRLPGVIDGWRGHWWTVLTSLLARPRFDRADARRCRLSAPTRHAAWQGSATMFRA